MRGFTPLIVHAAPCAAVRSRPSAGDERQRRSLGSISHGWTVARTAPHTGSSVYSLFYRATQFPVPCPAPGLRPGNICRLATGRCSERRRMVPSRHPEAGSSHHHCCSTHAPVAGLREIADNPDAELNLTINHPFVTRTQKERPASKHRPPRGVIMQFSVPAAFSFPWHVWLSRDNMPDADVLSPSPPVLLVSAPGEAHQTCR